ncbi:hypothetical protein BH11PSE4_BH11PSE4_15280 [soil metagenome]
MTTRNSRRVGKASAAQSAAMRAHASVIALENAWARRNGAFAHPTNHNNKTKGITP